MFESTITSERLGAAEHSHVKDAAEADSVSRT